MVFKCQEDSFLKEFTAKVIECNKAELEQIDDGQTIKLNGYNVILNDTILFPEGGGQPCDHGLINGNRVVNVIRRGDEAIHFIVAGGAAAEMSDNDQPPPLKVGDEVNQVLDWDRRFDHMQQHSGQHLITSIFEQNYKFNTTTWWLGANTSFIELDTKKITTEQISEAEKTINQIIAGGRNVSVIAINSNQGESVPIEVTRATRGLPKDHIGAIRVVTFDGIESNMCCGTHVTNLSQLQMVKFLHTENRKNKILLHFLVGNRVVNKLSEAFGREMELNVLLNCGPHHHIYMVKKLKNNLKTNQRTIQKLFTEMAKTEADQINACQDKYYFVNRTDGSESEYLNVLIKNVNNKNCLLFLSTEEPADSSAKGGKIVITGPVDDVDILGPELCSILDGKGNGKNGRFQAKVNNLKKKSECHNRIKQYFENQTNHVNK